ncbi:MAG TPA: hypothetical protein VGM07_06255 [Stellaceae bacterium]|jgi:hypothetical protein
MRTRDEAATVQLKLRIKEPLRATIEREADRRGLSMNAEAEDRIEQAYRDEQTRRDAFRPGLVTFLRDLVRAGAGSKAIIHALILIDVPDVRSDPENLARSLIFDLGFDDAELDDLRATEAARWRERLGPELGELLRAAYHRLRDQLEDEPREPPAVDREIAASWDAAMAPHAQEKPGGEAIAHEGRMTRRRRAARPEKKA